MCPLMAHLAQPLRVRREPIACLTYDLMPRSLSGVESGGRLRRTYVLVWVQVIRRSRPESRVLNRAS